MLQHALCVQWKGSSMGEDLTPAGRDAQVQDMAESLNLVVTATELIVRYVEARGEPMCKDQLLRLLSTAVLVTAKYWDDGAAVDARLNAKFAQRQGIPLDEMNMLEINLIRGCGWNVGISLPKFNEWRGLVEQAAEQQAAEQQGVEDAKRNASVSPSYSTQHAFCSSHASAPPCPSPQDASQPGGLKQSGLARLIVVAPLATSSSSATTVSPLCRRPSSQVDPKPAPTPDGSGASSSPSTCGPDSAQDFSPPFGAPHCARRSLLSSGAPPAPAGEEKGAARREVALIEGLTVLRILEVPAGLR